ncbi:VPEID-CTERM sorting domain-containing protein [Methylobacter sp. YRD-M1]|uniref:VPEID-CTERM sorting domain-containing protein n=1 Tax=Methylobacter sp. YRD-M1 TaxID=2911520 RepID=UPI00227A5328|nr:VPEID-CTERM sorting domain-containing protein [Methylobacter sp. YRD-M1]WAK00548.1 VPEID-CTERM sorting domain-containing protein [Methylobacter sp. YRD-M1]
MNIRQMLLAVIAVVFLATGNAWADEDSKTSNGKSDWFSRSTLVQKLSTLQHKIHAWRNKMWQVGNYESKQSYGSTPSGGVTNGSTSTGGTVKGVAPEIDAASGTSAIALLTGVLLLAAERSRSRRVGIS